MNREISVSNGICDGKNQTKTKERRRKKKKNHAIGVIIGFVIFIWLQNANQPAPTKSINFGLFDEQITFLSSFIGPYSYSPLSISLHSQITSNETKVSSKKKKTKSLIVIRYSQNNAKCLKCVFVFVCVYVCFSIFG